MAAMKRSKGSSSLASIAPLFIFFCSCFILFLRWLQREIYSFITFAAAIAPAEAQFLLVAPENAGSRPHRSLGEHVVEQNDLVPGFLSHYYHQTPPPIRYNAFDQHTDTIVHLSPRHPSFSLCRREVKMFHVRSLGYSRSPVRKLPHTHLRPSPFPIRILTVHLSILLGRLAKLRKWEKEGEAKAPFAQPPSAEVRANTRQATEFGWRERLGDRFSGFLQACRTPARRLSSQGVRARGAEQSENRQYGR